jgi:hypothetical protein
MEFKENFYNTHLMYNFNKKITKHIFNFNLSNIQHFLNIDNCENEYNILSNKINLLFNDSQLDLFSNLIIDDISGNNHIISKYYIKLTHLLSSIFNITSNNFQVINNKLNYSFNVYNIPEIKYVYKSKFDINTSNYNFDVNGKTSYNNDLTNFCNIFLNKKSNKIKNYSSIHCNDVTNMFLKNNMLIYKTHFHEYSHNLTILIQLLKKYYETFVNILNEYFIFDMCDMSETGEETIYIKNIISMDTLNSIIETLRDLFIEYFQNIEAVFHKTKYSFKIFMLNKMADTIQTRIICPPIH